MTALGLGQHFGLSGLLQRFAECLPRRILVEPLMPTDADWAVLAVPSLFSRLLVLHRDGDSPPGSGLSTHCGGSTQLRGFRPGGVFRPTPAHFPAPAIHPNPAVCPHPGISP